ncbi:retinoid isomerohydrolase-like [Rhopilema esculentum]|uniref:retinoid isomerohydrolase-like n=1 Tax=Rhopilema esculentum TaxID=499914 RepID=UPI0031D18585|eukprot:gene11271-21464_t
MMSFLVHNLYLLAVLMVQVYGNDPNYRNIFYQTTKEVQNEDLSNIQGEVPHWIDGDFVRQNCASYGDIDGPQNDWIPHMFDCISMVGRYEFKGGKVRYSNRFYDTKETRIWKHYNYSIAKSKVGWNTLFSPIDLSAYVKNTRIQYNETLWPTPNVNFWQSRLEDPVFAMTESIYSAAELKVTPELEVLGNYRRKFNDKGFPSRSTHDLIISPAHEQREKDGTIWHSTIDIERASPTKFDDLEAAIIVYKMKGSNRTVTGRHVLGKYNLTKCRLGLGLDDINIMPGYHHYMETTSNYIIVPMSSYLFDYCQHYANIRKLMGVFPRSFKFYPNFNSSLLLFDRSNMSNVHRVFLPFARLFTHSLNAFEDGDYLYLDTMSYRDPDLYIKTFSLYEAMNGYNWSTSFIRIAINKNTWSYDPSLSGSLTQTEPYGKAEFTQINYDKFHNKDYTYTYFLSNPVNPEPRIAKLNVKTKNITYWVPPVGYYPQEPVFLQPDDAVGEDEGVILCSGPVSDTVPSSSFLAVLNATDMKLIAMVKNPNSGLISLHNRFYKSRVPATKAPATTVAAKPTTGQPSSGVSLSIVQGIWIVAAYKLLQFLF